MTYVTHALGGLAAGLALLPLAGAAVISGAIAGSLLPDIDHTRSFISRSSSAARVASYAASAAFRHRGFTHTPAFVLLLALLIAAGLPVLDVLHKAQLALFLWGLPPGALSHLILDSFNKGGVMWLWPLSRKRFRLLSIRTDSLSEKIFAAALGALVLAMAAKDTLSGGLLG
jgi:inner membrane protein